jgi:hypothetical protein
MPFTTISNSSYSPTRSVQGMLAHFMRFRDGKIVELREFMDSLHAAEQALGRELIEEL